MTLQEVLDKYCLARSLHLHQEQVGLANALVDEHIPELVQKYAEAIIERNKAMSERDHFTAYR